MSELKQSVPWIQIADNKLTEAIIDAIFTHVKIIPHYGSRPNLTDILGAIEMAKLEVQKYVVDNRTQREE